MGKKRDQRLVRQAEKAIEFERKKIRQAAEPDVTKHVAEGEAVSPEKSPPPLPEIVEKRLLEWSRDHADIDGAWSWGPRSCLEDDWEQTLHPFLREYAKKTWFQIYAERTKVRGKRAQKHHDYAVASICKEAQSRLLELEMDDVDRIFRFRLSGLKRLYGIQRLHLFMVLWWDPEHKICPTTRH